MNAPTPSTLIPVVVNNIPSDTIPKPTIQNAIEQGDLDLQVNWPASRAQTCAQWLKAWTS